MKVEGVNDLADGQPLQVVQHAREHQGAVADLAMRQQVRRFGLEAFFTFRAPVPMDDVFGHDGLEVFGDVFGQSLASVTSVFELAAAIRTGVEFLVPSAIRIGRRFAMRAKPGLRAVLKWTIAGLSDRRRYPALNHCE